MTWIYVPITFSSTSIRSERQRQKKAQGGHLLPSISFLLLLFLACLLPIFLYIPILVLFIFFLDHLRVIFWIFFLFFKVEIYFFLFFGECIVPSLFLYFYQLFCKRNFIGKMFTWKQKCILYWIPLPSLRYRYIVFMVSRHIWLKPTKPWKLGNQSI